MDHNLVLAIVSAIWVLLELVVGIVSRAVGGVARHDRGSCRLMWMTLIAGTFVAGFVRQFPIAQMPDSLFWVGIGLMLAGMIVRAVAIATLRRFFTVKVTIQQSHELVDRGIYRFLRHPSYSGALISFIGLGFAFGSWLSMALILVVAAIGFGYRIRVEEAALTEHFGDRYREYSARTKRLIPGLY